MQQEEKNGFVPKLRFPEFRDGGKWIVIELRSVSQLVTERVGGAVCTPYTITSGVGLISQEEKLGRIIAGKSLKNYTVLQRNDFAYNKSATIAYPQGFIASFLGNERAAVPNSIFTCFRVNQTRVVPDFLRALFANNLHGAWLRTRIAVGARAHGSLQVSDDDLMTMPVPLPGNTRSLEEQQKIADCLSSIDVLIDLETNKIDALKFHKIGLMQQLFPAKGETKPRLRFPEFEEAGEWEEHKLGDVCELYQPVTLSSSELTMTGEHLVYGANGVIGTHNEYNHADSEIAVTCRGATCGEVTRTQPMSWITGNAMVVRPRSAMLAKDYVFQYFKNHGLKSVISGSAQPQITRAGFSPLPISFPTPSEQQRIADFLNNLDDFIAAEIRKLDRLKTHKKGLMQQLFPKIGEADA